MAGTTRKGATRRHEVEFTRRGGASRLPRRPLREVMRAILADCSAPAGTVSVCAVGDAQMRHLSSIYKGEDDTTDVLAFNLSDDLPGGAPSGEIVVNSDLALAEAHRYGNTPARELALYVIHGTLHLQGFDDRDGAQRRRMRRAEAKYLALYDGVCAGRGRSPSRQGEAPSER